LRCRCEQPCCSRNLRKSRSRLNPDDGDKSLSSGRYSQPKLTCRVATLRICFRQRKGAGSSTPAP
jgi:hypothetical protein